MSALAEAIVLIGGDDRPLRSTLANVRTYLRQQVGIFQGMLSGLLVGLAGREALGFSGEFQALKAALAASVPPGVQLNAVMLDLEAEAVRLGRTTLFSSRETTVAMKEMAQAGAEVHEIFQGLPHVLDLAAAGQLKLEDATNFAISTLRQFDLPFTEMQRVVDVMSQGAARSATTIQEMGRSLSYVGSTARNAGLSLEQTVALMSVLSNAGERGTRAGTSARTIMARLPQGEIKGHLEGLVGSIRDGRNQFREFDQIVDQFREGLARLAAPDRIGVLNQIFGMRGSNSFASLMRQGGDELRRFEQELQNAGGTAQRMRQIMEEGLSGSFRTFKATLSTLVGDVGQRLVIFPMILGGVRALASGFLGASASTRQMLTSVLEAVGGLLAMQAIVPRLAGAFGFLSRSITAPMGVAYAAVARTGFALAQLARSVPVVSGLMRGLSILGGGVAGLLTGGLVASAGAVTAGLAGAFKDTNLGPRMREQFAGVLDTLNSIVSAIFGINETTGVWTALKETALGALTAINAWLTDNREGIVEVGTAVKNIVGSSLQWVMERFRDLWSLAGDVWQGITGFVNEHRDTLIDLGTALLGIVENAWSGIRAVIEGIGGVFAWIGETTGITWGGVLEVITSVFQTIRWFTNDLKNSWNLTVTYIALKLSEMMDFVKDVGIFIKAVFLGAWEAVKAGVLSLANNVFAAFQRVKAASVAVGAAILAGLNPFDSESAGEAFNRVFQEQMAGARAYQSIGRAMGAAWERGFSEATVGAGETDRTKALRRELDEIMRQMDQLDAERQANARNRVTEIMQELRNRQPAAPPGQSRQNVAGGTDRLQGEFHASFVGIAEMAKKIQEGLFDNHAAATARNTERGAVAAEQTRDVVGQIRDQMGNPGNFFGLFGD